MSKASFAFCQEAIGQLEDGKLGDQVTFSFRGQSRTVPRINMVLGHALDLADHCSQSGELPAAQRNPAAFRAAAAAAVKKPKQTDRQDARREER
jgi:hypothetical protein